MDKTIESATIDQKSIYNNEISAGKTSICRELRQAKRVLVITGAGISADSGLPTYRGIGGLYSDGRETEEGMTIEEALSGYTMKHEPEITWKYIKQIELACRSAKPNAAHHALVELESKFEQFTILTQNIDGFHRLAGSKNLIEMHGNIHELYCTKCNDEKYVENYEKLKFPPRCSRCRSTIRPKVVLFGEMLPKQAIDRLSQIIDNGIDAVLTIGTSSVFPYIAGPVLQAAEKNQLTIEINPSESEVSDVVRHRIQDRAIVVLPEILKQFS